MGSHNTPLTWMIAAGNNRFRLPFPPLIMELLGSLFTTPLPQCSRPKSPGILRLISPRRIQLLQQRIGKKKRKYDSFIQKDKCVCVCWSTWEERAGYKASLKQTSPTQRWHPDYPCRPEHGEGGQFGNWRASLLREELIALNGLQIV